jgi:hypothetical protein
MKCPFCPDHVDTEFVYIPGFRKLICEGCAVGLSLVLAGMAKDPELVAKVEEFTGKPWEELRLMLS